MNRTIKFRAIFDGKVVEYVKWEDSSWMYSEDQLHWYYERKYAHTTLSQFTGLLDKNGKEIYEGDIVGADERMWKVIFHQGAFEFQSISDPRHFLDYSNAITGEIIGNIYENSDLLV